MKRIHKAQRLRTITASTALIMALAASSALAGGPQWRLSADAPDDITAGKNIAIDGWVENVGDIPLRGSLTVTDTFPADIVPVIPEVGGTSFGSSCHVVAQTSTCTIDVDGLAPGGQVRFRYGGDPANPLHVDADATGTLVNTIDVAGGGMSDRATSGQSMTVGPPAPFQIDRFTMNLLAVSGGSAVRAGSAPHDLTNTLALRAVAVGLFGGDVPFTAPIEHFKDTIVHAPAGFVGNPTATPIKCTTAQLTQAYAPTTGRIPACPQDSQVGTVHILSTVGPDMVPLYSLVPPVGTPAAFGFSYQAITIILVAKLRPYDNGIDIVARKAPSSIPISAFEVAMWGVPADSSHDYLRHLCMDGFRGNFEGSACPSSAPRKPFLRMPTSCFGSPLPWSVDVTTYEQPSLLVHADTTSPGIEGCQFVPFDPSFSLVPSEQVAHAPTGVDVTLSLPQDHGPDGLAEADLRMANIMLPDGMAINPSSADGLKACSDADLRLGIDGVATCPDASKIGTATLTTPLLDHPLGGAIFLRTQASADPTSGEMFRLAIEVRSDDDGIDLKLPGAVKLDSITGQLTTTFDELPQLPFSTMQLHFKNGPRAPLVSPRTCGGHTTTVQLTSWSDAIVNTQSAFSISGDGNGAPCPAPRFSPAFRAGTQNPVAGTSSPLLVSLRRDDGDQQFKSLTVETPRGLLGRIKSAELCSDVAGNAGICGDGALIGRATVGAGAGTNPFFITDGKVFLTGPYKGAPYGLSVVTRAIAGPFDLGTVVVRAAIHLDKRTAALSVVSEALPTIVKGVPLNLRVVRLSIDKPDFMVNPTSCEQKQITGTATSTEGTAAPLSSRFQVGNCKNLRFVPRITMSVGARGRTTRGTSTPLATTIRQSAGQSNLQSVKVTLPTTLNALLPVINRACTLSEYEVGRCSKAEAGSAVAVTPLLGDPLRGAAYFVRNPDRPLPDLMIALRGDVDLDLVGKVTIPGGKRLATEFDTIPDAPVTSFTLRLTAGRNGPLGVAANLCGIRARSSKVAIEMRGQNGDAVTKHQRLRIRGCGGAKRGRR